MHAYVKYDHGCCFEALRFLAWWWLMRPCTRLTGEFFMLYTFFLSQGFCPWFPVARLSVILHLPNSFTSPPITSAWKPIPRQHASPDPASHMRCLYKRVKSRKVIVDGVLLKAHRDQVSLWGPEEMTYDLSLYANGQQHSVAGCKSAWNVLISSA